MEIGQHHNSRAFPALQTLLDISRKDLPKVWIGYTYVDDDGNEVTQDWKTTLPEWLCMDSDRCHRVCAHSKLEDLFYFYQNLHTVKGSPLPATILSTPILPVLSSKFPATVSRRVRAGKWHMHIISVTFNHCRSPTPWYVWEFTRGNMPSLGRNDGCQ